MPPGGIRSRSPSKRAATGLRLIPRGHLDRRSDHTMNKKEKSNATHPLHLHHRRFSRPRLLHTLEVSMQEIHTQFVVASRHDFVPVCYPL